MHFVNARRALRVLLNREWAFRVAGGACGVVASQGLFVVGDREGRVAGCCAQFCADMGRGVAKKAFCRWEDGGRV